MGLPFLGELEHVPQREVWGAGLSVEGIATEQLVRRLFDPPLTTASELPADIHELAPPGAQIGRFSVDVKPQLRHQNTTLAIKVNGEVVVCTDTEYDESNAEFAHGARVLCHDSFFPDTGGKGHTGAGEAAKLAVAASVQRLVLIHLNPLVNEDELLRVAREAFPATEVGRDGMML
jgi:ribonuclease BN (tRNA processing enzyme)